jgi:chaperone required for assembly of F1-ATPase
MAEWEAKVFWKVVAVTPAEGGFAVTLDGRPVRTPGKRVLVLPTRPLAEMVAAEWAAQSGALRPDTMPATRTANSAVEKVAPARAAVIDDLAGYGGSDLLSYRAEAPAALQARQQAGWDPLLDWAAAALGARLATGAGIIHVPQPPDALSRLRAEVAAMDDFRLAAFHDLVALSGSLVLALAVVHGRLDPETAWALSRLDEDWQAEHWGRDDEAEAAAALKRAAFIHAARFHAAA